MLAALVAGRASAQNIDPIGEAQVMGDTVVFRFPQGEKMFYAAYKGNDQALDFLSRSIRANYRAIDRGDMMVRVQGFCSWYGSRQENLVVAKDRSNQVKSYFIIHEGLKEKHFKTSNSTAQWHGLSDVVAVAYLFRTSPAKDTLCGVDDGEPVVLNDTIPAVEEIPVPAVSSDAGSPSQTTPPEVSVSEAEDSPVETPQLRWAVKTNVAYLAATVANVGVELAFGKHYSVDFPVIYSPYTVKRDYKLRFLAIQPEFRYWLTDPMQKHFFGVHLNIGAFNVAVDSKNRYQSPDGFYGVGISYGYVLPFARHWAAEFTVGAGYVHTKYDAYYNIPNGARYEKGVPYNYWGLTKVGINLVYKFGK